MTKLSNNAKELKECKYHESCDAQLCPLDTDIEKRIYYADEPTCKLKQYQTKRFIQNQKKLKKRDVRFEAGCFTYNMLNRKIIIKKGITGLDPDSYKDLSTLEQEWIGKHPEHILTQKTIDRGKILGNKYKHIKRLSLPISKSASSL